MSEHSPSAPTPTDAFGRVVIVASRYNSTYTDAMVAAAGETLERLAPEVEIKVVRVPGAFEIPIVVEAVAMTEIPPLAIIALGVIIRGSTAHADLVAESVTRSLHSTSLTHLVPVIHEVLLVNDEAQARARTQGETLNRGREAAEAAVAMIGVMADVLVPEEKD